MSWNRILAVLGLAAVLAGPAVAQEPAPGIPAGSYVFVAGDSESVERAIDRAVSHMNFLARAVARSRLRGSNKPVDRIEVDYPGDEVWISLRRDEPPIVTPRDGTPVEHRRADGEVVEARTVLEPDLIRQTFVSDDVAKEIVYRLRPDGRLAMEVTVRSDRLREPLTYTWVFRPQRP